MRPIEIQFSHLDISRLKTLAGWLGHGCWTCKGHDFLLFC